MVTQRQAGRPLRVDSRPRPRPFRPVQTDSCWAPYLMGERTPHLDPDARGALVGLTASHTRAPRRPGDSRRGPGYSLKDTLRSSGEMKVPMASIRLGGGGARSQLWRQILIDMYRSGDRDRRGGGRGSLRCCGYSPAWAAGLWPTVDAACSAVVRVAHRVTADAGRARRRCAQRYDVFRRVYPALRALRTP